MTPIESAIDRVLPDYYDKEFYLKILLSFPNREWFAPTNKNDNAYDVCKTLSEVGIIAIKRTPMWLNGSFKGFNTEFMYSQTLNY